MRLVRRVERLGRHRGAQTHFRSQLNDYERRSGMMPLVIQTLPDRIFKLLHEKLTCGEIKPGQIIGPDSFALMFGTSKIPVREALSRLEGAGLAVYRANKGFAAAPLSIEEAHELFSLRRFVEPPILAEAALKAGANSLKDVRYAYDGLCAAVDFKDQVRMYRTLFQSMLDCGAPATTSIPLQLLDRCQRYCSAEHKQDLDISGLSDVVEAWLSAEADDVQIHHLAHLERRTVAAQMRLRRLNLDKIDFETKRSGPTVRQSLNLARG